MTNTLRVTLTPEQLMQLETLAYRQHRVPASQIEHMLDVLLDVFTALPKFADRSEETEVLLGLVRDELLSERGQAYLNSLKYVHHLEHQLKDIHATSGLRRGSA